MALRVMRYAAHIIGREDNGLVSPTIEASMRYDLRVALGIES